MKCNLNHKRRHEREIVLTMIRRTSVLRHWEVGVSLLGIDDFAHVAKGHIRELPIFRFAGVIEHACATSGSCLISIGVDAQHPFDTEMIGVVGARANVVRDLSVVGSTASEVIPDISSLGEEVFKIVTGRHLMPGTRRLRMSSRIRAACTMHCKTAPILQQLLKRIGIARRHQILLYAIAFGALELP